jgi:hypothetical protein
MDLEFELATSRNPYRTVFQKMEFSLAGFLAAQFLLVSSQPIGFQARGKKRDFIYFTLLLKYD